MLGRLTRRIAFYTILVGHAGTTAAESPLAMMNVGRGDIQRPESLRCPAGPFYPYLDPDRRSWGDCIAVTEAYREILRHQNQILDLIREMSHTLPVPCWDEKCQMELSK